MTLRELLKIELWSKETSRSSRARVGGFLRKVLIAVGVLVVALLIVVTIEFRLLTPGERRTAKDALASIDSLQDFGKVSDGEFVERLDEAKTKIQRSEDSVWTVRDSFVAETLFDYWVETKSSRSEKKELEDARRSIPQSEWGPHGYLWNDPNKSGAEQRGAIRSQLHKILD